MIHDTKLAQLPCGFTGPKVPKTAFVRKIHWYYFGVTH